MNQDKIRAVAYLSGLVGAVSMLSEMPAAREMNLPWGRVEGWIVRPINGQPCIVDKETGFLVASSGVDVQNLLAAVGADAKQIETLMGILEEVTS